MVSHKERSQATQLKVPADPGQSAEVYKIYILYRTFQYMVLQSHTNSSDPFLSRGPVI